MAFVESLSILIGVDPSAAQQGLADLTKSAQATDAKFNEMSHRWAGVIKGLVAQVIAPVAGGFAIGKIVNSYMNDVSQVATLTGAYSQKLEEWRIKRAQLARVTKEDIELYKKSREAVVGFNIAMADLSAKITRSFSPVIKLAVEGLEKVTKWLDRNGDNITRFLLTTAGVLTTVFTPALVKMGVAMLASPLTWLVAALGAVVLVIDDLVTYIKGGDSALSGFWSQLGTGQEILEGLTTAFNFIKRVLELIWPMLAALAANFAIFKTGAVLVGGFTKALQMARAAMLLLMANPLMLFLTALVALVMWVRDAFIKAGGDWGKAFALMGEDIKNVLGTVGAIVGKLINLVLAPIRFIADTIGNTCSAVVDGASAMVTGAVNAVVGFVQAVGSVVQSIKQGVSNFVGSVAQGIANAWQGVTSSIGAALGAVGSAIGKVASAIGNAFIWANDRARDVLNGIVGLVRAPFDAIRKAANLSALWEGLQQGARTVVSLLDGIGTKVTAALASVKQFAQSVWQGLVQLVTTIGRAIATVVNVWLQIHKTIGQTILNAARTLISGVVALWQGLISGIKSVMTTVVGFITEGFAAAVATIENAIATAGRIISTVAQAIGRVFVAGATRVVTFYQGLWRSISTLVLGSIKAVTQVIAAVRSTVTAVGQAIRSTIDSVIGGITGAVRRAVTAVTGAFASVVTTVTGALGRAAATAQQLVAAVSTGFKTLVRAGLAVVTGALTTLRDGVGRVAETVTSTINGIREAIAGGFAAAWDFAVNLVTTATDAITSAISSAVAWIAGAFDAIPTAIEAVWARVTGAISGALDSAMGAVECFVDQALGFFGRIASFIADIFDIKGLISKALDVLPDFVSSKLKSALGIEVQAEAAGEAGKERAGQVESTPVTPLGSALLAPMAQNFAGINQAYAQTPVTASSSSIVTNNSYREDRRSDNRKSTQNTTININTTGDPRAIARTLRPYLPSNTTAPNNFVSATEQGVWSS